MSRPTVYLVDVSSMFFRAFFAIPRLNAPDGLPTNALYGLASMCIRLLREVKPEYVTFCFDRPEPSFRAEIYPEYKANRDEMPSDLVPQMPFIPELIKALGFPVADKKGFEADDIIGTLARRAEAEGYDVVIVSGDKDFAQLVSPRISLLDTMKNQKTDISGVVEKWGVRPDQMIDYLAIVGDTSDNVPGVHGVGPKGAQKLLADFGTLENVYANVDGLKGALKEKMRSGRESAFLARKLVTIVTDVPLELKVEDLKLRPIIKEELRVLFERLGFSALLKKMDVEVEKPDVQKPETPPSTAVAAPAVSVTGQVEFQLGDGTPRSLSEKVWTAADVYKNIPPYSDVWAVRDERGTFLGVGKEVVGLATSDATEERELAQILQAKRLSWHGFDLKRVFRGLMIGGGLGGGIDRAPTPKWDAMLACYVVKSSDAEDFSSAFKVVFGQEAPTLLTGAEQISILKKMKPALEDRLKKISGTEYLEKFELPLVPVLVAMESKGVAIDRSVLSEQSKKLHEDAKVLEKEIHALAGEVFNIASPKQLATVLFEKLKIPSGKKTKTGFSTGSDVLEKNARTFPICGKILDYRELTKLTSTYVDSLPLLLSPVDERVHTSFHQALTSTGRLSSTDPNLQNIPIRTERGRAVRKAFVAAPGHSLLSVDYSQIELRVLAEISGDENMTKAFRDGQDIHAATASEVFGVPLAEVTADQRRTAKAVNFGIAYGQGAFGLADQLGIPRSEAKEIIDNYFARFKKVQGYMQDTVKQAYERGYVETLFGRRRYLDELKSSSPMIRKFGERAAINAPMQGTASDLVKLAMIEVYQSTPYPMVLQVHDELLLEVRDRDMDDAKAEVKRIMEGVARFSVPLVADVSSGLNWADAH
jgi:DNA polymerase I